MDDLISPDHGPRTIPKITQAAPDGSVGIDYAYYEAMLDDPAMTAEDKRTLIDALWLIIQNFVMLGFGVHPVQHAPSEKAASKRYRTDASTAGGCGQVRDGSSDAESKLVHSRHGETEDA